MRPGQRRIRDYFARYRGAFLAGFLALVLTNLLALAIPWLLKRAVDALEASDAGAWAEASTYALWMAVAAVAMAVIRTLSRILIFNSGRRVEYDLRTELFDHLAAMHPTFFRERSVGEIMSRAVNDLSQVRLLLGPGILNFINTAVAYAVGLSLMLYIDPRLTLAALVPYPFILLAMRHFGMRLYLRSRAVQESLGEMSEYLQENLSGQQVIKAYAREEEAVRRFADHNDRFLRRSLDLALTRGAMVPLFGVLGGVGTLVVLYLGGRAVISGRISLGDLVAFNGYLAHLAWPTLALGWMLSIWQRGRSAMRRINELFLAQPAIFDVPGVRPVPPLKGHVEVRGLTWRWPDDGSVALEDIRLDVPAGRTLGIVGSTGGGKSTLVDLLPRLKPVERGTIFIDGHDVLDIPLRQLRQAIGYAPQDPFLFSATLHENIAFGRPEASREEVIAAAKLAAVHEDIVRFPRGYDTLVGERGVTLSGGQRQRIALARALLTEPRILILDDSLSSVDADTEARILASLSEVMEGRTALVVSHRIAAVKGCDEIIVLEGGRITQRGTHETLCQEPGLYADLWRRQRLEAELDSDDPAPVDLPPQERADVG